MQKQFAQRNIQANYSRFEAIQMGENPTIIPVGTFSPREKGCLASHICLLEQNIGSDKHLHILEDDVILHEHHHSLLENILSKIHQNWDILYTGFTLIQFDVRKYPTIREVYKQIALGKRNALGILSTNNINILGAFSYVVNKNSIEKLHNIAKEGNEPIDVIYQNASVNNLVRSFAVIPSIAKHTPIFPSTVRREYNPKAYYLQCLYQELFYIDADMERLFQYFTQHIEKHELRTGKVEPTFEDLTNIIYLLLNGGKRTK